MKSSLVTIVGRPSSGKSTLLNTICGMKVSIVSETPQTTRNKIRGILTEARGQIVFIDTPGYHHSDRKFNLHMKDLVVSAIDEIDIVLYVADVSRRPGVEEEDICTLVASKGIPVVVALNKIDSPEAAPETARSFILSRIPKAVFAETSAVNGTGVEALLDALLGLSPDGDLMYPEDIYTDQEPEFRVKEIIREAAINRVGQEVPHSVYVDIEDMEASEDGLKLWIRASINVERESQKGILVGKGGAMIKAIRVSSQKMLNGIFSYRVHLDLRVKVDRNWRHHSELLRKMIR